MKKKLAILFAFVVLVTSCALPQKINAANRIMTISSTANALSVGQTVTINIAASPNLEMFGQFNCTVQYDSSVFDFVSYSSNIGADANAQAGIVNIMKNSSTSYTAGNIISIVFRAKNSGNGKFTVFDGYGATLMDDYTFSGGASTSIKIEKGPAPTPAPTTTTTKPAQKPLTTVATLSPTTTTKTSPKTDIVGLEEESTETVPKETVEETTARKITFRAEDYKGRKLYIPDIVLNDKDIPSGFLAAEEKLNGIEMPGYYSTEEDLFLVVLSIEGSKPGLYFFDTQSRSFIPYLRFVINETNYYLTSIPQNIRPNGTIESSIKIKGREVPVLEFDTDAYLALSDYLDSYQQIYSETEDEDTYNRMSDTAESADKLSLTDTLSEAKNLDLYMLALNSPDKETLLFVYSETLDQLLPYDFLLMPVLGTFMDEDFIGRLAEDVDSDDVIAESEGVVTKDIAETDADKKEMAVFKLFNQDFKFWQILLIVLAVLLLLLIIIVAIAKAKHSKKPNEYPFVDLHSFDDSPDVYNEDGFKNHPSQDEKDYLPDLRDITEIEVLEDFVPDDELLSNNEMGNDDFINDLEQNTDQEEI